MSNEILLNYMNWVVIIIGLFIVPLTIIFQSKARIEEGIPTKIVVPFAIFSIAISVIVSIFGIDVILQS